MYRRQLAGLLLAFMAGIAQANPPSTPANTGQSPAPEASATAPRDSGETTAVNSKSTPLAQAPKADEHKLNKLKVYPCF